MVIPDEDGFIRTGVSRLYFRRIGQPDRGTVLVLHGGPGLSHEYLTPLADLIGAGYEVVFYDQLGCGRSQRPTSYRNYTIEAAAEEVDLLRRRLKLGRVHLFGHSYGGCLALEAAVRYPRAWRSLIVSSGFSSMHTLWKARLERVYQLSPAHRRALLKWDLSGVTTPATLRAFEEFRRRFIDHMENEPFEVRLAFEHGNHRILRAMGFLAPRVFTDGFVRGTMAKWDITSKLSRIHQPTLITVGQFDHVPPQCAREIHQAVHQSRLVIVKGQGHLAFFENRDRYISLLTSFLKGVA